jgi:hypothetical protein
MYKISPSNTFIIRMSDWAAIPFDINNTDYIYYLDWVQQGNTAEQMTQEELDNHYKLV